MLSSLYNLGLSALQNAQTSVDNASNNIANANTSGYQKTTTEYESSSSIIINGLTVGTGADITAITSSRDQFVETQYLDASADLANENAALEYLYQLDSLFNQSDDTGLGAILEEYSSAWSDLATDPDSESAREALLGYASTLIYTLNSTAEELETMEATINSEIQSQITDANTLIDDIAEANAQILANPDDTTAISARDENIRTLNELIGVTVINEEDGQVTILTEEGYSLVDGTETHHLAYGSARATESLTRASDYTGDIEYSGNSSEEYLIEFVSSGTDGTAQFKVSLDGGETWLEDEDGNTAIYTAGDEDSSVEIEGLEIWFENGAGDHAVGDRYTIVPKTGLYWEASDGSQVNITPMTDDSDQNVSGRTSGGSLAGLFLVRDDSLADASEQLDELTEALIWETNVEHSQGAGLEQHTGLTGSYSVDDSSAMLSNCGYDFEDNIQAGEIELISYDDDGEVATTAVITVDPATQSLDDIVAGINTAFSGELVASVNSDGQLVLSAGTDMTFEIGEDTSNLLAAAGVNTFFTGTDATTIAVDSYVTTDASHLNAGVVNDDGSVSSGNNDIATAMATLTTDSVTVGNDITTISSALSALVSEVGADAAATELNATYSSTSAQYYYDQQASASEVSIDEELIDLTKYQQAYQAAAEIITITRSMMDTILDMV